MSTQQSIGPALRSSTVIGGLPETIRVLRQNGYNLKPTRQFELGINAITHVLILFTALTLLFLFVVSKTETQALEGEFKTAVSVHLKTVLEESDEKTNGKVSAALIPMYSTLTILGKLVDEPDPATEAFNNGLFRNAYLTIGALTAVLVTMLAVMSYGSGVPVRKAFFFILFSNLVLFIIIGAVEFLFFRNVASKFVPTKPSLITKEIIQSMKDQFDD